MKKWLIGYIVLSLVILGVVTFTGADRINTETKYSECFEQDGNVFQYANNYYGSYLLVDTKNGNPVVVDVDDNRNNYEILDLVYYNNCVYYMYEYTPYLNKPVYGLGSYNLTDKRQYSYDINNLNNYEWLDLGVRDNRLYCLMNDIGSGQMLEFFVNTSSDKDWEISQTMDFPSEGYIVKAEYLNENINFCLDNGKAYYYIDTKIYDYKDITESPFGSYKVYTPGDVFGNKWTVTCMVNSFLAVVAVWSVFTVTGIVFVIGIASRNSLVVRLFSIAQLIVLAVIVICDVCFVMGWHRNSVTLAYEAAEAGLVSLADKSENGSVDYETLYNASDNGTYPYSEILVIEKKNSGMKIINNLASPRGGVDAVLMKAVDRGTSFDDAYRSRLSFNGKTYLLSSVYRTGLDSDIIWVGFIDYNIVSSQMKGFLNSLILGSVIIFMSELIIMGLVITVYSNRWKKFSNALVDIARNKCDCAIPAKLPNGLKREWSALKAISHKFGRSYYETMQSLEQYNKYVPKDIAPLLDKTNILDVEVGDVKKFTGNVVDMNFEYGGYENSDNYLKMTSERYNTIYETALKYEGTIISQDADFANSKVLFGDDINKAVEFAVNIMARARELQDTANRIIMIDVNTCRLGMVGCDKKAVPFLHYESELVLDKYKTLLRQSGVGVVLTENAVNKCNDKFTFRYIGYLSDNGRNYKIYECIDAYSKLKKEILEKTLKLFKKALGLYYSNDFYLARNAFNEVLKINPDDAIARWYLFNCEHNLNNPTDGPAGYNLFGN